MAQFCVNCNTQAGYPHAADCVRVKYWGDPDPRPDGRMRMIHAEPYGYSMEHFDEEGAEIESAMGTTVIPLPYTPDCPPETVQTLMRARAPGVEILLCSCATNRR